jgi:hypothetical protein
VSAPASLRTKPIDRRRLSAEDRSSYKPGQRRKAISKARSYKARWAKDKQRKQFATEQKPGTGGFTQGIARQQQRMRAKGQEERRAKSFRPENSVSSDIYDKLAT